jgi:transcriptional regulator with XRE-family HTH domain
MPKSKKTIEPVAVDLSATTPKLIGERLRAYREAIGLSQAEFARMAGVSPQALNNWERGRQRPDLDSGIALCLAHNMPMDWTYFGKAAEIKDGISRKIDRRLIRD